MVAMADLYATIILPEQVVTPTQETVINWQEVIMQFAKIIYWSGMLLLTARFFVQLGSIIRLHFQCSKSNTRSTRTSIKKRNRSFFFLPLDIHTPAITYGIWNQWNHYAWRDTCPSIPLGGCTFQRNNVHILLVQPIYLVNETGSQRKPRIHGRPSCIRDGTW